MLENEDFGLEDLELLIYYSECDLAGLKKRRASWLEGILWLCHTGK